MFCAVLVSLNGAVKFDSRFATSPLRARGSQRPSISEVARGIKRFVSRVCVTLGIFFGSWSMGQQADN
jgi:hypothetical protein